MAHESKTAIASVYARAIFELASERDMTEQVREDLTNLGMLIGENPEFARFLESPAIKAELKTESIKRVFAGKISDIVLDALCVLARRQRFALIDEIPQCYVHLHNEMLGRVEGIVVTAVRLEDGELERVSEQVGKKLNQNVTLRNIVDPTIIGGMIVTVEDRVMDTSLRRSLEQFSNDLRQGMDRAQGFAAEFMQ